MSPFKKRPSQPLYQQEEILHGTLQWTHQQRHHAHDHDILLVHTEWYHRPIVHLLKAPAIDLSYD